MEQKLMAADGIRGFMCSFRGNPSAYAIQHFKKGKQSYETVRSPLTEADIQAHLRGERTLGVYPLDGDMVHFATIDIDIETESLRADAQRYVRSIKDYAKELGTLLLVEDTGNRGYHLHALFDAPVPAKIARQLLRVLTIEVAVPPQDGVGVEIFPKQDVAEDLGNPIKLPCGVHKKTGIRSTIVNRDFKPVEQPIRTILKWPRIQVATLREILKTHPALGLHERHNCDETIASGYDEHGDPGQAVYQCEFLAAQLDNPYQIYDEWVAALSIPLPFGETGAEWAHKLSESYHGYSHEETEDKIASLRADGMSPWSCATIREQFAKCPDECVLEPLGDSEPSPVRFCYPQNDFKAEPRLLPASYQNRELATPSITDLLPPDGFLKDYLTYVSALTEAPDIFHLFVGLAVLSAVVNRHVHIPWGDIHLFPNLWMVLIAPTSYFRKSTAIYYGASLVTEVDPKLILSGEFSREALVETLAESPAVIIVQYEFHSLLTLLERSYMTGTKAILTELYDCPAVYTRKLKKQTIVVERPCLSIISASTTEWLNVKTNHRDAQSGFLARFMYIPVSTKDKVITIPPPSDRNLRRTLVGQLHKIRNTTGVMDISEIRKQHHDYVLAFRQSVNQKNAALAGFCSRLEINLLKMSMLIELSCSGSLKISTESHLVASRIVDHLAECLQQHVMHELTATEDEKLLAKIKAYVEKNPGCYRKSILQYCNLDSGKAWKLVNLLEESGEIKTEKEGKAILHYPAGYVNVPKKGEGHDGALS